MAGIFETIAEIIWTIISETIKTVLHLFKLFMQLLKQASPLSSSGPAGFAIFALLIGGAIFFLGKYVFHAGKTVIMLIIFGIVIFVAVASSLI